MGLFVNVNESTFEMDYENFIECHEENMLEAGATILVEAEQNWNAIMEAVGIEEVRAYAEGTEAITESGRVGGMLEKAKQFFMNLWKKVVGMFKKLLSIFDQQASKDKAFVKKYRTEVAKKMGVTDWNKDLSIDIYKFKDLGSHTEAAHKAMKSKVESEGIKIEGENLAALDATKINGLNWKDEIGNKVRSFSLGGNSTESESEFRKEWKEKIWGSKENEDVTQQMVLNALKDIENTETVKKTLKKAFEAIDKPLKTVIKNTEKAQNNVKFKKDDGTDMNDAETKTATEEYSAVGIALNVIKAVQSTLTSVYSMECQAIKDNNRQCRAIVGKVFRRPVKEAGFEHFEEGATYGNAFDSIRLV